VLGHRITLQGIPFTIVGVTPPAFGGPEVGRAYDVAIPFGAEPLIHGAAESWLPERSTWWLSIMLRLKKGQTADQGTRLLRALQPQIREATLRRIRRRENARTICAIRLRLSKRRPVQSYLRGEYQRPARGADDRPLRCVLIVACANIANLLLARAMGPSLRMEPAAGARRLALASRRQLLVECLLLTTAGGAAALVIARWGSQLLLRLFATNSVALESHAQLEGPRVYQS
jgi:hypothetical protein